MVYQFCLQMLAIKGVARGSATQAMAMKLIAKHMISLTGRACTMRRTLQTARSRCR